MLVTLTPKRGGILKKQIETIEKELNSLLEIYKDVKILELSGFDESEDKQEEGCYYRKTKTIEINRDSCRDLLSERDFIRARKELRDKIEKRERMGLKIEKGNSIVWNRIRGLRSLARHEFAHAIADQYNILCSGELMIIHACYTEDEITKELSAYANKDIGEFLAVAFEESFYEDCSELAKKVRKLIDRKAGILDE